jgi:hypothetical protein
MRGAIYPLHHYAFMAWCSLKAQGQLYLYLLKHSIDKLVMNLLNGWIIEILMNILKDKLAKLLTNGLNDLMINK